MVEPLQPASGIPAPAAPPVEAPAILAPVVPAVEAAPAVASPAAAAPAEILPPAEVPSLLEGIVAPGKQEPAPAADASKPPIEAKPAEVKPPEAAPSEAKPTVAPVAPTQPEKIEWKFELPATLKADEPRMTKFTGILDELLAPKEGETRVQVGQRLVDLHNEAMTAFAEQTRADQIKAFNETRQTWRTEVMSDPKLGGAGHQTAMGAIARMRDMLVSDAKPGTPQYQTDIKQLNDFLRITGAGDNPVFLRMLHRVAGYLDEPKIQSAVGIPTKNNGVRPNRGLYRQNGVSPS